jgi:hypothetical protein
LLFNAVFETAVIRTEVETGGNLFDKCSQIIAYAAGVVITCRRLQDVKEEFSSLSIHTKRWD